MIIHYTVNLPLEKVLPYFTDFQKFGTVHPYIVSVEKTVLGYHVTESITLLGFIKNRNEYDVSVENPNSHQMIYRTQVKSGIDLTIVFEFEQKESKTLITESLLISGPLLVKAMLGSIMKSAHKKLIANINNQRHAQL